MRQHIVNFNDDPYNAKMTRGMSRKPKVKFLLDFQGPLDSQWRKYRGDARVAVAFGPQVQATVVTSQDTVFFYYEKKNTDGTIFFRNEISVSSTDHFSPGFRVNTNYNYFYFKSILYKFLFAQIDKSDSSSACGPRTTHRDDPPRTKNA